MRPNNPTEPTPASNTRPGKQSLPVAWFAMGTCLFALFLIPTPGAFGDELPKAADGFVWHEFPNECVALQVPVGWQWREQDNHPAQTVRISPWFTENGGFDSGFTLNTVVCRNPKEWKDAYFSALQFYVKATDDIKALGKPTFEKTIQSKNKANQIAMQVLVVEGDSYLPGTPHPDEKYRVRTIVRAIPPAGVVYVYSIGALVKDWDRVWKIGATMLEPIAFRLPAKTVAAHPSEPTPPVGQEARKP